MTGTFHEDLCTLYYLAEWFLEWEMFQTRVVEKIYTRVLYSVTFLDNVEKYARVRQVIGDK
jgi:hypothetical protein